MVRLITLGAMSAFGAAGMAQPCSPHWEPAPGSPDMGVHALAVGGPGASLYVGGRFSQIGGVQVNRIARWDGAAWAALGSGIPGEYNSHGYLGCCANVHAIREEGGVVHIAGNYIQGGGVIVESIADYSNGEWRSLAGGVSIVACADCAFVVYTMARFGDSGIGALYAAGTFDAAGGVPAARIARWDGQTWSPVGAGIGAVTGDTFPAFITALSPFGGFLYAGGMFSAAGGLPTLCIARWDGVAWSGVGGGLGIPPDGRQPSISAMAVFDDGTGPALYVAGILDIAGGVHARNIARWDGASWSGLGAGVGLDANDRVWTLAVFDDGSGSALYVGGEFAEAGGVPAANIAKWDGHGWSAVGAGVDGPVHIMAEFNAGAGPELFVGGWFQSAGESASPYLARWVGCTPCYANCDHSTTPPVLNVLDFGCFMNSFAAGSATANCDQSTASPILNINDFACFLNKYAVGCGR